MASDEHLPSDEAQSCLPRYFESAYLAQRVVYVQEEGLWRSYGPKGELEEASGTIPESIRSQVIEVDRAKAEALIEQSVAAAKIAVARQAREIDLPHSKRDTYLGVAALVLAAGQLLSVTAQVVSLTWPGSFSEASVAAVNLLSLLGTLLHSAGLAVVAWALLGGRPLRAQRIRMGAWLLVGRYFAWALTVLLAHGAVTLSWVLAWVLALPGALAFVWVARAFSTGDPAVDQEAARTRNRRLGVAGAWLATAVCLSVISEVLVGAGRFGWGDRVGVYLVLALAADVAWLAALVLAAHGFIEASRGDEGLTMTGPPVAGPYRLRRRDGLLATAAGVSVLFGALAAAATTVRLEPWALSVALSVDAWTGFGAYLWLMWISDLCLVFAGLLCVFAFVSSRRSLRTAADRCP